MTSTVPQSTFVTVVAWLMLIFFGMAAATGLLQSALVVMMMPIPPLTEAEAAGTPAFANILFANFHWFVWGLTAFWVAAFVCALGMLRRLQWGRVGVIAVFVVLAVTSAGMTIVQQVFMTTMFEGAANVPADAATMMAAVRIGSAVFGLAFTAVFAWLAAKLSSRSIRAEFT